MKYPYPKYSYLLKACIVYSIIFLCCHSRAVGQTGSTSSRVTIKALELRSTRTSDGESNFEYRVNTWFNNSKNSNCIDFDNVSANTWHNVKVSDQTRVSNALVNNINVALDFDTEAWEEDGCDGDCSYDYGCWGGSDEAHCGRRAPAAGFEMILYNMVPGNFTGYPNLRTYNYCGTDYQVKYLLTYSPPQPDRPTVKRNGTTLTGGQAVTDTNCDDPEIELTSNIFINPTNLGHVEYFYEYRIGNEEYSYYVANPEYCGDYTDCSGGGGGPVITSTSTAAKGNATNVIEPPVGVPPCCTVPPYILTTGERWRAVTGSWINAGQQSTLGGKKFKLRELPGLENITTNTYVRFRVTAYANGMTSPVSATSFQVAISPQSPKADPINFSSTPSCPLEGTGTVSLTGISSQFPNYKYILRLGDIPEFGACNPNSTNCFPATDKVGTHAGATLTITDVLPGTYTLFMLNNAGTQGFCPRRIGTVTVGAIPNLDVSQNPVVPVDPACYGVNTGAVTVSITGGRPNLVTYKLDNITTSDVYNNSTTTANASTTFEGLKTGNYTLVVSDGCTPSVSRSFIIRQPVKVSIADFETGNATCNSPGNGRVSVAVSRSTGTFDKRIHDDIYYQLWKDGVLYHESTTSALTLVWNDLQVGNYRLIVTEKNSAECNGTVRDFSITGPPALGISTLVTTDATCFGSENGSITVTGNGGTGAYQYSLLQGATNLESNTTGVFTGLKAGSYSIVVKNQLTCNDSFTQSPVTIQQPTALTAVITKTDITCHNLDNGKITSVVGGGVPGYTYAWQYRNGTVWQSLGRTGNSIDQLEADAYRVVVTDSKGCTVTSNEVTIVNPAVLTLSSASVTDITCFGGTGTINPVAAGGTAPYTFSYASGSNPFTTLTATTPLGAGSYKVQVTDTKGCVYQYPTDVVITAPPSALSFTTQLSDYSGYNISCFGGSNGTATLTASGGNGASYTGYQYAIDGGTFTTSASFQNINAGNHTLSVRDARGCVVSQVVNFTQTTVLLQLQLVNQVNVVCFGDKSGELTVSAQGGVAPYEYQVNSGPYQTAAHFTQLEFGDYAVTVKDKNGCTSTTTYTILSVNPPLEIETTVTDVSCFGGNDGSIAATVSGGVSPFTYQWPGGGTNNSISGLTQGTYTVTVSDAAGCKLNASATVLQPLQPLGVQLVTVPVCYGETNGFITVSASGGTSPYVYSIDNGANYQSAQVFESAAGSYTIITKDSHGCTISASAQISVRNSRPEPNFLAATSRNALDVIAIVDVSVPKPDSIHWVFDPAAIVIDSNPWAPALKFMEPGTYGVNMTGYFEGCDYTIVKTISVNPYDPNAEHETLPGYQAIESLVITPNPSDGVFDVALKLNNKYRVSLVVYDMLGVQRYTNNWNDVTEVNEKITLLNAAQGVYMLRVITEKDARDVRVIIK